MYEVYLGLGSNLGDREGYIKRAEGFIFSLKGVKFLKSSSLYLTEPWGNRNQEWFLNKTIYLECSSDWTPFSFLKELLEIENIMGRKRTEKWGPRNIDIDLLIFGEFIINTEDLILPHPYITKRAFVMIPLLEINPFLKLPTGEVLKEEIKNLRFHVMGRKIYQKA